MKILLLSTILFFSSCASADFDGKFRVTTFDSAGRPAQVYDVNHYRAGQDRIEITVDGKKKVIAGSFQVEEQK